MYLCSICGYGSVSWIGKCPHCGQWNSFVKEKEEKIAIKKIIIKKLTDFKDYSLKIIKTNFSEFNRVLGKGIVENEVVFLTGEPGVGKSTLLLQSLSNLKTFYVAGEESPYQLYHRTKRLSIETKNFFITEELEIESIIESIKKIKNKIDVVVIDSIQTVYSQKIDSPIGSITQLKEIISQIITFAKKEKIPFMIVGHITKEGEIAGPKSLEHLVDCVLSFEGDKLSFYRLLRAEKNRFGSTDEVGIFEMTENGLKEINNPLIFLNQKTNQSIGRAVAGTIQGKRPLFFEIQTLVSPTLLALPRRITKGVDYNKVLLLLAVLKKYLHFPLDKYDIYVNITGGIDIKSPSADLAIVCSLISSFKNLPLPYHSLFIGEIGLLGEIRKIPFEEKIINEGKRLGFKQFFSSSNIGNIKQIEKIFKK
mgnify:CR=1 FL=1